MIIIYSVSPSLSSSSFVFTSYYNGTGFSSPWYVIYIGSLFSVYSFAGFEAAGTCAEETINESTTAPKGIVYNVIVSYIVGFFFILSLLYGCENNYEYLLSSSKSATVNLYTIVFNDNEKGVILMSIL